MEGGYVDIRDDCTHELTGKTTGYVCYCKEDGCNRGLEHNAATKSNATGALALLVPVLAYYCFSKWFDNQRKLDNVQYMHKEGSSSIFIWQEICSNSNLLYTVQKFTIRSRWSLNYRRHSYPAKFCTIAVHIILHPCCIRFLLLINSVQLQICQYL